LLFVVTVGKKNIPTYVIIAGLSVSAVGMNNIPTNILAEIT